MEPKRQKNVIRAAVIVAVLAGLGWTLGPRVRGEARAEKKGAGPSDRVVPVVVTPVIQRDVPITLDGLGNVVASATVMVRAQVDGRLDRVAFREGQEVKKGELLAQIDPRPFQNQLHQAEAALARSSASLVGAQQSLDRSIALRKEGLASQQQIDELRTAVAQVSATLRSDAAQIETARLALDFARVTAPIDGITGVRLVDAGNIVRASDPTGLVVITAIEPISVVFTLPQDDLPRVTRQLAKGPVRVDALRRDGTGQLATGELALVDNQINQATATMRLKAIFSNADRALWPNQLVKARLLLDVQKGALVVPAAVVQRGPQGTFAYVVVNDVAEVRPIQIAPGDGEQVVVLGGLQVGEQVVVDGQYQLKPKAKVSVRGPDAPAGGGKKEGKEGRENKGGKGEAPPAGTGR